MEFKHTVTLSVSTERGDYPILEEQLVDLIVEWGRKNLVEIRVTGVSDGVHSTR